ncbi:hypothetical protein NDA13_001360 [Ustilago tritici]|nr:hypothetical protein NDA13_001360 [Ustilago tritici]
MLFINKVFEAGSWDVSLPPSPTPPSNTEQEQGAPPVLSLATGSSAILPCPSPVTSPINWMSDTPSAQSTRPANNGAKKNFVWQAQDIKRLVETIYINKLYRCAILPSCHNKANEPANKLCKDTFYCDLSRLLFPARSVDPSCIKFKVHWLQETYHQEKKALLLTGAGTLLKDMDATNPSYMSHVALSAKYPWFEKMHEMMNKRVLAGPAILLTTPSLDVAGNKDSDHVLPSGSPMEESSDADLDHAVHAHNLPSIHDLVDATPRNAGDTSILTSQHHPCIPSNWMPFSKQDQLNSIIQTLEVSLPAELDHYAEELQDPHFVADDYNSSPDTDNGPTPLSAGLIHMYTLIAQQRYSVSQIHTQGHSKKLIELLD